MSGFDYSVNEAKEEIKNSIEIYMQKDEAGNYIIPENKKNPFYLVGAPGIGKTEIVGQIARELGIGFISTSLTHHTRNSILGLPVIIDSNYGKATEYTMPDILSQVEKKYDAGEKEGILLIDEFASMSEALVAPMLAFLQSKCIGNHFLPEGWVMVLCSNPPEYNETARVFDAAVMDRVRVMNLIYSKDDFIAYAKDKAFHPAVIGFIQSNSSRAYMCESEDEEQVIVTTRGWENLSNCLYGYERSGKKISSRLIYQFIKSKNIANEFMHYYILYNSLLTTADVDKIIKGCNTDKYLDIISEKSFEEKWQFTEVLLRSLSEECRGTNERLKLNEYMEQLIHEFKRSVAKAEYSPFDFNANQNILYNVIRKRLGLSTFIFTNSYESKLFKENKLSSSEEMMLNDVLKVAEQGTDPMNTDIRNDSVIAAMESWLRRSRETADRQIVKKDECITHVIDFVKGIGEGEITEPFIRNLNQSEDLLYIISCTKNKAYVDELDELFA